MQVVKNSARGRRLHDPLRPPAPRAWGRRRARRLTWPLTAALALCGGAALRGEPPASPAPSPAPPVPAPLGEGPTTRPSASPAARPAMRGPSASNKLDEMLQPRGSARPKEHELAIDPGGTASDAPAGRGGAAPNAPAVPLMREGSYVVDRTGRLIKSADGQNWEFTFEADGKAMQDPPLVVLPNLKLMAMESAAGGSNRDMRFRITGQVTEYRGRNYVLLDKVTVLPDQQY